MLALLMALLTAGPTPGSDSLAVAFSCSLPAAAHVSVAGSFNNWDPAALPLKLMDGVWRGSVMLVPGHYYYKLVVDGAWMPDPGNDWRINDGGEGFNSIVKVGEPAKPTRRKGSTPLPRDALPAPVCDGHPEWIDLYWAAWEMAWAKIQQGTEENGFVERYMDEGFNELIFQWDTCFMAMFGVYAPGTFPAMESLDNFYRKQRDDGYIQRVYWERDGSIVQEPTSKEPLINPPLFAWVELRYFTLTGDSTRLPRVLPLLARYYEWIDANCRTAAGQGLYYTTSLGSGMDNTPREGVGRGAWIDFSAQQALAARCIASMASAVGDSDTATLFQARFEILIRAVNALCWSEPTQFYHDLSEDGTLSQTVHIGAFWTLLSDVCPDDRLDAMIGHLTDPREFWRPHPIPTLAAGDPAYDARGHYWRGGVWAPTNYMVLKGLERKGRHDLARRIATAHLSTMSAVFQDFMPEEDDIAFEERYGDGYHTIWECYSPEDLAPATRWDNTFFSRQDFAGWSGLGPIAMLLEHAIGLDVVGSEKLIRWRIFGEGRSGVEGLWFQGRRVSLIAEPAGRTVMLSVETPVPFSLEVEWRGTTHRVAVQAGKAALTLP